MEDKEIVFKYNKLDSYEKELKRCTEDFISAILALDSAELNVRTAHRNLDIAESNAINAGLTGSNQQQRDAQLAVITTKERNEANEKERILLIAGHTLDIVSANLTQAKLEIQFITAAINGGLVIGCATTASTDLIEKEAKEFSDKFK